MKRRPHISLLRFLLILQCLLSKQFTLLCSTSYWKGSYMATTKSILMSGKLPN